MKSCGNLFISKIVFKGEDEIQNERLEIGLGFGCNMVRDEENVIYLWRAEKNVHYGCQEKMGSALKHMPRVCCLCQTHDILV